VACGVTLLACAINGAKTAWIAPYYKNTRPLWRFLLQATSPLVGRAPGFQVNKAEKVVSFPSGGLISLYSADNPDSIRGESFHLVIMDEAAMIREEVYQDVVYPTVADYEGKIILISTPKGLNWFYELWSKGQAPNDDGISSYRFPSNSNPLPGIQKAYERARKMLPPRTFEQEWNAAFVEDSGVFEGVRSVCTGSPGSYSRGRNYVVGVDWARAGEESDGDYTVMVVMDSSSKEMQEMVRFRGVDFHTQQNSLIDLVKKWNADNVVADSTGMGLPVVEELARFGMPIQPYNMTNASKADLIERLALGVYNKDLTLLDDPDLISEMTAYTYTRLPSGLVRYHAPSGLHDDIVVAVALAYWASEENEDLIIGW
jgi:phage terminase large subunit-like protein